MPEKLNSQLNKKTIVVSFIVTIAWFVSGHFYPDIFYFTWIPLITLIILFIYWVLPDKYLISTAFSLLALYELAENLIIRRNPSPWESMFWLMDFLCTLFVFFFVFSIRFFQNKSNQNSEKRREAINIKLLKLILVTIITSIIFCLIQTIFYDSEN